MAKSWLFANSAVMSGRAHAQEIGTPGASAEEQQQPGNLKILELGDAVEQVLVLLVRLAELVLNEGAGANGALRTVWW